MAVSKIGSANKSSRRSPIGGGGLGESAYIKNAKITGKNEVSHPTDDTYDAKVTLKWNKYYRSLNTDVHHTPAYQ